MTKSSLDKRLLDLESVNPAEGIVLHFADGSTRFFKIHKKSVLGLFCASMKLAYFDCHPEEFTAEKRKAQAERKDVARDPRARKDAKTGRPITKYDFLLELLGRAVRISGPAAHHLVSETWAQCRMRVETLRRGERFYLTQKNMDPFFDRCLVGPYAPDVEARIQKAASDARPDGPVGQSDEAK